ncbi:MAG: nuclear transport factor 2 family protein [Acidimicrobiia bacterium]|nr:nuclear transport factor 2 family protein [Acidimicrobiia bacterium]
MADANEQIVRDGYEAFGSGDMEKLGSLYKDDVVHSVPGSNQIAGDYKGRDAVLAFYGKLFELTGGNMSVDLKTVTVDGNKVAAVHRAKAAIADRTIDSDTTLNFTMEDGRVARIDEVPSDQAAEDDFWGQA